MPMYFSESPKVSQFTNEPYPHSRERYHRNQNNFARDMRKYYKLILSVITFVSVVSFIFYKTQYDRLHNVLEVLEFFGANEKGGIASTSACSPLLLRPPTFQRLTDDLFTFSSFCQQNPDSVKGECPRVTTIVLARADQNLDSLSLSCQLWYEGSVSPVKGVFTSTPVPNYEALKATKSPFLPINFNCESKFVTKIPYGITYESTNGVQANHGSTNGEQAFVHVEDFDSSTAAPQEHTLGACVLPTSSHADDTPMILQNIMLNAHFGLANFLFYDNGLTHRFFTSLARSQKAQLHPNVHIMPWNPPSHSLSNQVIEALIEQDCHFRSRALFQSWLVMNVTQVLVVRGEQATIQEELASLDRQVGGHLQVPVRQFCQELPADTDSDTASDVSKYDLPALHQLSYYEPEAEGKTGKSINLAHHISPQSKIEHVPKEVLLLHDYGPCNSFDFEPKTVKKDLHLKSMQLRLENRLGSFFGKKPSSKN